MKKTGFIWKIYLLIFSVLVYKNSIDILEPTSFLYSYYHTLIKFDSSYWITYALAVIHVFFELVGLVQLSLFIFRICLLTPQFWQWMLILRFIFNLTGCSGELKTLSAIFYASHGIFLSTLALIALVGIPSYAACFQYAFRWEKSFTEKIPK